MVSPNSENGQVELAAAWERLMDAQERFERVRAEAAGMVAVAADARSEAARALASEGATHRELAEFLGMARGSIPDVLRPR